MGFRITCKLDNTARATQRKFRRIQVRLPRELDRATDQVRKMLEDAVRDLITKEHPAWAPLSRSWLTYKQKHGLMMGKLKATGKLRSSIEGWKTGMWSGFVSVGGGSYKNGKTVRQVAIFHEKGTRRMPERPIFRPMILWKDKVQFIYQTALSRTLA